MQPHPAQQAQQHSAAIERLEETASRMSSMSQQAPELDPQLSSLSQTHARLGRDTSVRSADSGRYSTHSSLLPTPLNWSSTGEAALASAAAVTSPVTSARTYSWSQASGQRSRPNSRRTQQRTEPEQEGRPLDSMLRGSVGMPSRTPTVNSRKSGYQPIAPHDWEGQEQLGASIPQDQHAIESSRSHDALVRSGSTASRTSTLQGARSLFRDFDGTHYSPIEAEIVEEDEEGGPGHEDSLHEPEPLPSNPSQLNEFEQLWRKATQAPTAEAQLDPTPAQEDPHGQAASGAPRPGQPPSQTPAPLSPDGLSSSGHAHGHGAPQWAVPPPEEGMVYYPAPVPMTLNLPKRLSRQPQLAAQNQRRSQLMKSLPDDAHKSTPWLPPLQGLDFYEAKHKGAKSAEQKRQSNMIDLKKLPPQLRASLFFDQQPINHTLEIKQDSVVTTLDSLLDASATTPVGVPAQVAKPRRSTTSLLDEFKADKRKSKISILDARPPSNSVLEASGRRSRLNHSTSTLELPAHGQRDGPTVRAVLGDGDSDHELPDERPSVQRPESVADFIDFSGGPGPAELDTHEHGEPSALEPAHQVCEEDELDDGPTIVQPTTLLAELQLRKHDMRSRNRNAAGDEFPRGMRSTLLELDAVAQVEERQRKARQTQLAWQDPSLNHDGTERSKEDDDVPLGLLFPHRNGLIHKIGLSDDDKPLGLLEKRELEDNEPLSKRRNRILGRPTPRPQTQVAAHLRRSPVPVIGVEERRAPETQPQEPEEFANETLVQRRRRLRSSRMLDEAIGGGKDHSRAISDDFASEMMSQFDGLDQTPPSKDKQAAPQPSESPQEETLGQRRRRLQTEREERERQASANSNDQPARLASHSLANLLSDNPVSKLRPRAENASPSNHGLLGAFDVAQASRHQALFDRNTRATSFTGQNGPLVGVPHGGKSPVNFRGEVARDRAMFAQGVYNDGSGGQGHRAISPSAQHSLLRQRSAMSLGVGSNNGLNGYMQGLAAGGPKTPPLQQGGHAGGYMGPKTRSPQQHLQLQYTQLPGMGSTPVDPGHLSPKQRETIDRWRLSVLS